MLHDERRPPKGSGARDLGEEVDFSVAASCAVAGTPRVVTAAVTVDLVGVDFTRVSSLVWSTLARVTPRVALEVTVGDDLLVIEELSRALRRFDHVGPVHVRSSTAWAADMLACALDPRRPRTVRYPDPWATHDEGDLDG